MALCVSPPAARWGVQQQGGAVRQQRGVGRHTAGAPAAWAPRPVSAAGTLPKPAAAPRAAVASPASLARTGLRISHPSRSRTVCAAASASVGVSNGGVRWATVVWPWLHLLLALGAFVATDRLLLAVAASVGLAFPAPLLGMFLIIATLLLLEARLGSAAVEVVVAAAAPAVDWIGRWLPLFYVPSLVTLPLALTSLPPALLAKVSLLLALGWLTSLLFAAAVTVRIRAATKVELLPVPPAPKAAPFTAAQSLGWASLGGASAAWLLVDSSSQLALQAFLLAATICGFLAGTALPPKVQKVMHPLFACALVANAAAAAAGQVTGLGHFGALAAYLTKGSTSFLGAGDWLMAFLHSVILSFGFRVFSQRQLMRRHFAEIMGCVLATALFSMALSAAAGAALGLPQTVSMALAPRSVTVALALPIAALLGAQALASLTAVSVMLTGLLGANFAQPVLTAFGYTDPVVRGLATAASAHGLGTAALAAKEPEALPMAALAYATMGVVSSLLVALPQVRGALLALAAM